MTEEFKQLTEEILTQVESNLDSNLKIYGNKDYYPDMFVERAKTELAGQGYNTNDDRLEQILQNYLDNVHKLPYDNYTGD